MSEGCAVVHGRGQWWKTEEKGKEGVHGDFHENQEKWKERTHQNKDMLKEIERKRMDISYHVTMSPEEAVVHSASSSLSVPRPPPSIHRHHVQVCSLKKDHGRRRMVENGSISLFGCIHFCLLFLYLTCSLFVAERNRWVCSSSPCIGREGKKKGCSQIVQKTKHSVPS